MKPNTIKNQLKFPYSYLVFLIPQYTLAIEIHISAIKKRSVNWHNQVICLKPWRSAFLPHTCIYHILTAFLLFTLWKCSSVAEQKKTHYAVWYIRYCLSVFFSSFNQFSLFSINALLLMSEIILKCHFISYTLHHVTCGFFFSFSFFCSEVHDKVRERMLAVESFPGHSLLIFLDTTYSHVVLNLLLQFFSVRASI